MTSQLTPPFGGVFIYWESDSYSGPHESETYARWTDKMKSSIKIALSAALMIIALPALSISALAHDHDRGDPGPRVHGAPGPIAGAGLPILAVGYGVYWLVRRRRNAQ